MRVIKNESVICFDVDDTLVCWDLPERPLPFSQTVKVLDPYDNKRVRLRRHEPHIKLLKNHFARGSTIIVWSQSGFMWAEAVVQALGLVDFVDFVMTKPRAYCDDLPVQEWLRERIYLSPDSAWGNAREVK